MSSYVTSPLSAPNRQRPDSRPKHLPPQHQNSLQLPLSRQGLEQKRSSVSPQPAQPQSSDIAVHLHVPSKKEEQENQKRRNIHLQHQLQAEI